MQEGEARGGQARLTVRRDKAMPVTEGRREDGRPSKEVRGRVHARQFRQVGRQAVEEMPDQESQVGS